MFGERKGYGKKNKKDKKRDRIACASVVVIGVVTLPPHREGPTPSPLW